MESVLDLSVSNREANIKFTRKALVSQFLWVGFNIALLCFDWFTFTTATSRLTCVSFGAMLVTALWSIVFMLQTWNELRNEKHQLRFLTGLRNTQIASGEIEQYKNVKKHYEQLIEQLKEKKND